MGRPRKTDRLPTSPAALERYQKIKEAMRLRALGMGWREVAEQVGYKSHGSLITAVHEWMDLEINENAEALRQREIQTMDLLQRRLMTVVLSDKEEDKRRAARAAEVIVKISERRARLLGLDAAEKREVEVTGPTVIEYVRDDRQEAHKEQLREVLKGTQLESLYTHEEVVDAVEVRELPALPAPRPPDQSS